MKNRVLSFALSILLLLGLLPFSVQATNTNGLTLEMAQAYLNVLNNCIATYGTSNVTNNRDAGIIGQTGLAYSDLVDFDGNGMPELYMYYVSKTSYDNNFGNQAVTLTQEIWKFDGKSATKAFSNNIETDFPEGNSCNPTTYGLVEYNGKVYLSSSKETGWDWSAGLELDVYKFAGSSLEKYMSIKELSLATTMLSEEDRIRFDAEPASNVDLYTCDLNNKRVKEEIIKYSGTNFEAYRSSEVQGYYNAFWLDENEGFISTEGAIPLEWKLKSIIPELTAVSYANLDFNEIKAKLPYTGNLSQMNMSPKQADSFLDVLENYSYPIEKVAFFDAGNGIPAMWFTYVVENFVTADIWEWNGNSAVKTRCKESIDWLILTKPGSNGYIYYWDEFNTKVFSLINGRISQDPISYEHEENGIIDIDGKKCGNTYESEAWESWANKYGINGEPILSYGSGMVYYPHYDGNWVDGGSVKVLLDYYIKTAEGSYTYPDLVNDSSLVSAISKALANELKGKMVGVYKLASGLYYVVIDNSGKVSGAIIKAVKRDGQPTYALVEKNETCLDPKKMVPIIDNYLKSANITIDYGITIGLNKPSECTNYLESILDNMDGTTPNDLAKSELAALLEDFITDCSSDSVKAKNNQITISGKNIEKSIKSAEDAKQQLESVLLKREIQLNKTVPITLRVDARKLNWKTPIQVTFEKSVLDSIGSSQSILLLLDDSQHSILVKADSLKSVIDTYGALIIQMEQTSDTLYTITFVDTYGNAIQKLPTSVSLSLPADSDMATVLASYNGGSDNWGGQYDSSNSAIEFSTKYSGQYEVMNNDIAISDLDAYSDEQQTAIRFMVSKGYFELSEGAFLPAGILTRYDFTQAMVKMFFALDRELQTSFSDVLQDSPFYPYVASAEKDSIVLGFDDGEFKGNLNISKEQVIALCARTLAEKKGYTYPEYLDEYLTFSDSDEISDWAREAVALAVREGLIDSGNELNPQGEITRAESAQILYKLFMLLYETSPTAFVMDKSGAAVAVPIAAGASVLFSGGGAVYFILKKKKASLKMKEIVETAE